MRGNDGFEDFYRAQFTAVFRAAYLLAGDLGSRTRVHGQQVDEVGERGRSLRALLRSEE
jgi:hypothetical protein